MSRHPLGSSRVQVSALEKERGDGSPSHTIARGQSDGETTNLFPWNYSKCAGKSKPKPASTRKQGTCSLSHTDTVSSYYYSESTPVSWQKPLQFSPPTDKETSAYIAAVGVRDVHCDKHYQLKVLIQLAFKTSHSMGCHQSGSLYSWLEEDLSS